MRNKIGDRIEKRHGVDLPRDAWWKACRDLRKAIRDLFRRPARSIAELQIKAQFWGALCRRPDEDNIEIQYLIEDAIRWFNDAMVSDLKRLGSKAA